MYTIFNSLLLNPHYQDWMDSLQCVLFTEEEKNQLLALQKILACVTSLWPIFHVTF